MFFILIILTRQSYNLSYYDIGVAVWSGYECIYDRMVAACNTWIKSFPEVTVYSDFFPKGSKEMLQDIASPTKLVFYELGDCRQHILVTPWQRAQPRFVKAMEHFYRTNTSKKFYFFCDDDSFPIARNLMYLLKEYNPEDSKVIGKLYCSWNEVIFGTTQSTDEICVHFAQGGAGVVVTATYFARIVDSMSECNEKFNKRRYAGSMRFAKCSWDKFGDEWNIGRILDKGDYRFYSSSPFVEMENGEILSPYAVNFHKMYPWELYEVSWATRSLFKLPSSNQSRFTDWTQFFSKSYKFTLNSKKHQLHLKFGLVVSLNGQPKSWLSKVTSQLDPIFDKNQTDTVTGYIQKYGNGFSLEIHCDENQSAADLVFDYAEFKENIHVHVLAKCPPVEEYVWL